MRGTEPVTDVQPSFFDRPAPYQRASDTSQEAADEMYGRLPRLRAAVLQAYVEAGRRGLTPDECAHAIGESVLAVRPRATEFVQAGLLEKTGERRLNSSGMKANVLRRTR
jgi:DNA-directed RNA polymerase specialized sigma24 family protein